MMYTLMIEKSEIRIDNILILINDIYFMEM